MTLGRRQFLQTLAATSALLPLTPGCARREDARLQAGGPATPSPTTTPPESPMTTATRPMDGTDPAPRNAPSARMPVLFVGHGSPMNAITENPYSATFAELGRDMPRPAAILAVSAHWFVGGTYLTADAQPRTIHDFSGFPRALHEIEYRAPGSVDLAERVRRALGPERAGLSTDWGLDHGTWTVLRFMFPEADIPVVQLSIDRRLDVRGHLELSRSLGALRDEGVLVLASGNITHNLRDAFTRMQTGNTDTPAWAARFDAEVTRAVSERDTEALLRLWPDTEDGRLAHPSPDHFLPLLYAYGASDAQDAASFTSDVFDLGSLSMRNVRFAKGG